MPSKELFIGGLDRHCSQSDLESAFDKYGRIERCSVKNSASGAVFAFIEFEDENSAEVNKKTLFLRYIYIPFKNVFLEFQKLKKKIRHKRNK